MSKELKTYDFPVDHGDFTSTVELFYLKSEADKVIAEKDKEEIARLDDLAHAHNIELLRKENLIAELEKNLSEIQSQKMQLEDDVALLRRNNAELKKACKDKDDWCLHTLKENRHQKYKRCLAMVKRCEDKIDNPVQCDEHDDWLIITEYWNRWHKRWLELAEKFKPSNTTAQQGKG